MSINVDPAALEQASGATNAAINEGEATASQLAQAKASLDGSISALRSAINVAFSGWSAGAGFTAFESAQSNLTGALNNFDEQIVQTQAASQRLNQVLIEFKNALAMSGGSMSETDSQIASAWGSVR